MTKKTPYNKSGFSFITEENWFRQSFDENYLWLYAHRSDKEAVEQVRVATRYVPFEAGQKVLDIACGAGRHMLAFARRGARVTGIDLSPTLIETATGKFKEAGLQARLLLGDMRNIKLSDHFDGVTLWFTSFGYFATVADDRKVLEQVRERLKTGGWWWIDLPHPAYLEKNLIPESERQVTGPHGKALIREKRRFSGRRVIKTTRVVDKSGRRVFKEYVRLYRPEQFGAMLAKANLSAEGVLGDYDGSPLTGKSPRQIWFGRRLK